MSSTIIGGCLTLIALLTIGPFGLFFLIARPAPPPTMNVAPAANQAVIRAIIANDPIACGQQLTNESGFETVVIYEDVTSTQQHADGENIIGQYAITNIEPGTYILREMITPDAEAAQAACEAP